MVDEMIIKDFIAAREELINLVKKQMLGPGSEYSIPDAEHEIITDSPARRYSCGILFPQEEISGKSNETKEDKIAEEWFNEERTVVDASFDKDLAEQKKAESLMHRIIKRGDEQNEEKNDTDAAVPHGYDKPSSFGITFFVEGNTSHVRANLKFGCYRPVKPNDCRFLYDGEINYDALPAMVREYLSLAVDGKSWSLKKSIDKEQIAQLIESQCIPEESADVIRILKKLAAQCVFGQIREPYETNIDIDFSEYDTFNASLFEDVGCEVTAVRRHLSHDLYVITLMIVNIDRQKSIFQPKLKISTQENDFIFKDNRILQRQCLNQSDEERRLAMLYRNKKCYASGLGTSVNWEVNDEGKGIVSNDFFPLMELPSMDFNLCEDIASNEQKILSMKYHSDLMGTAVENKVESLNMLLDSYAKWIDKRHEELQSLPDIYKIAGASGKSVGEENLADCAEALARMRQGLELLASDRNVQLAFSLANRAMFMQRIHLDMQRKMGETGKRYNDDKEIAKWMQGVDYLTEKDNHKWRPFQIAFLLMSIPGIVKEDSADRKLVDLIWFPTGGGKTEAYLGLSAFVIFYRRLAYPDSFGGTNIIMRYTLRLLTTQQFNRAATLICACELIRKEFSGDCGTKARKFGPRRVAKKISDKPSLGEERITIGIWIGSKHTPNKLNDAKAKLEKLKKSRYEGKNVFQVLKCPWCGTSMVPDEEHRNDGWGYMYGKTFFYRCPQDECNFSGTMAENGLPIQTIDETMYKNPPTLLIGTVDKFAMMAWNESVGAFFKGRGPELIIQDELHLISGPLGSMVGLYETAIDYICSKNGHSPKIIASTATIRRAKEQCSALYNRDVRQFPAPGLEVGDSYFAKEKKIDYKAGVFGRKYVGLMPAGKNKAFMQYLLFANVLEAGKCLNFDRDELRDMIWTVAGYFGSLKDLGACSKYMDEDVPEEIRKVAVRLNDKGRLLYNVEELTSRVETEELNEVLDRLEKIKYRTNGENEEGKRVYPIDAVLSTNMISVGIDISRLNVMVMVGQPKLTSEYIQASSRVGRSNPGTVFVMYDGGRSRDQSYFEQFKDFHETIYSHVEPTGATPFSAPARERALHAVVVSMIRATVGSLSEDGAANDFSVDKYRQEITAIKEYIVKRFQEIRKRNGSRIKDDSERIIEEITAFLQHWEKLTQEERELCYGDKYIVKKNDEGKKIRLLRSYGQQETQGLESYETMTSMRSVDSSIAGELGIWRK